MDKQTSHHKDVTVTEATLTAPSPYAAPASNLQKLPEAGMPLTVEQALVRGYDFGVFALLGEAWERTKGTKRVILGSYLLFTVVMMGLSFILPMVLMGAGAISVALLQGLGIVISVLLSIAAFVMIMALIYPFVVGVLMVGIRRAADQPIIFGEVFSHFGRTLPLVIAAVLMTILICIGNLLFLIPGIYLGIAYSLTLPLIVERGLSPWQAMEASRKGISQHWFKVLGLYLLLGLIIMASMLTLGILLIWTLPMMVVANGILYRTIFGVLPQTK